MEAILRLSTQVLVIVLYATLLTVHNTIMADISSDVMPTDWC